MGAVDLVVQIESPPSVASALQRVGRAGHQVGEVSRGVLFPKHRGDLAQTAVVGRADALGCHRVAAGARPTPSTCWPSRSWRRRRSRRGASTSSTTWCERSASFAGLPRSAYDGVLDLLAGRYPSDEFAELRPRIVWDRVTGELTGPARRPAARGHQRRHHPRPWPLRRLPRRWRGSRAPGRRARRGDGLRVAGRRHLRARRHQLAHRGHHPRPGAGHPGAGHPGPAAVLEGRRPGPARRARRRGRRLHPRARARCRARRPRRGPARTASTSTRPATWSPTCTSSSRPPTCCPATPRCSSSASATSSATGAWCCTRPTAPRCTRRGRWPSTPACASATASTARPWPPTTAS